MGYATRVLRVALLHDFDEPRLFGIRFYTERLRRAIDGRCTPIDVHPWPRQAGGPEVARALITLFVKEVLYPLEVRRLGAEVAHVVDQSHAHLVRWLRAPATVVTCHDLWGLRYGTGLRRAGYRRRVLGLRSATRVAAVSRATREEVIRLGVDPTRVHVVRNRVDPFFLEAPAAAELRETAKRFALDGRRYVLHVGNNLPYKNIDRLLSALGEIPPTDRGRPLLVKVGAGLSPRQLRLARRREVGVRCLGEILPRELRALYHLADCLAYPSLYEGFGWPVAEALASGLPVVAGNVGALPELAGGAALLVDPENTGEIASAIHRMSEDRALREELAARGRDRGAWLAEGDFGAEMLEIYRAAVQDRG